MRLDITLCIGVMLWFVFLPNQTDAIYLRCTAPTATNSKLMPAENCLSAENYTLALRYTYWKLKTAKRLSKQQRILFERGFELDVQERGDGERHLVFYKKDAEAFSVNAQELISRGKASDLARYHQLFCTLVDRAKFTHLQLNYTYHYHDGSNNVWKIGPKHITYQPITPAMSSTGTYSGGEPYEKEISPEQYQALETLLKAGINNKAIHEEGRLKGSGMIVELITDHLAGAGYHLPMRSAEKVAIEAWLKQLKE